MKRAYKEIQILDNLLRGNVYRLEQLASFSHSIGRDIKKLETKGALQKVGPGLYYYPKKSWLGNLPPDEYKLIKSFLKTDNFLVLSSNWYNSLGLGLMQLRNETFVYNTKRYEMVKLCGRTFDFRRPNNGFPRKLSKEFLLVDLVNNISELGESIELIKNKIAEKSANFDSDLLIKLAKKYGKVGTKKFLLSLLE
jgi:hypothetical protein